jgi:hypothetical protein
MAQSSSMIPVRAWWRHGAVLLETRHKVRGFESVVIAARVSTLLGFEEFFLRFLSKFSSRGPPGRSIETDTWQRLQDHEK